MPVRLLPWQPEYGTAMQFDADAPDFGDGDDVVPDLTVEASTWAPITRRADVERVYLVDGVRRAEAHALDDDGGATPALGLFGSYAIGAVALAAGRAGILRDRVRVERRYLHTSNTEVPDRVLAFQRTQLAFTSRTVPTASRANDLVAALNRAMLDEEARLAETLSEDESALTLVDGPLRSLRSPGRSVVGYVKRIQQWYVPKAELELLQTLLPGERTPLFLIPGSAQDPLHLAEGRYSWFVRLPAPGPHVHYLGGVLRLECSASISPERAAVLADQTATLLPRLASSPVRDPRAPQNLTPIGALETHLTHLLGDRRLIARLLAASIAREEAA
ncbi:MAG: DNA double-strand break repair nuclease NurA [Dehalococcoidia bacterium]|nr:DNA double-strand break repair nuclease NurA [Dehalococcoidia bacterium]MCA9849980.1 DNA double-strand break repair nuclease NurA [Dehalococcoidia bacterium]MCA9857445.1 DNA double-strand break repair nuclease NurA [Dehalococcoidia bacterium]MCB9484447.1 DNA double-strand break repair nuclease NurA [Dehalococcoidia bacterium]